MKNIGFECVDIKKGFWYDRQEINRRTSVYSVYDRFKDTGRVDAFSFDWKEGMEHRPHIFWDSDLAKWIETVAYILVKNKDEKLEALADEIIDKIEEHQGEDGYFNIYFTVVEPEKRFTSRDCHELYCAGHLIEAAVAYYKATGKRKMLDCMEKYAQYIEKVFMTDNSASFVTPGHEEIELALVKLYECTGNERYLRLSEHFLNKRGYNEKDESKIPFKPDYSQSHIPVREQRTAEGHAVRATYLYSAMADIARIEKEKKMTEACDAIFENIVTKRMYVTGGIGSSAIGEAFTKDYDLPNITAYTESCAAIGLAFFAKRMQCLHENALYADIIERIMYNGFLSSVSLDGRSFFYENPLEIPPRSSKVEGVRYPITQRLEVFDCSCCPPNITRFFASIADGMYTVDKNTVYVQQYIASDASFDIEGGKCRIIQDTDYPNKGEIKVRYEGPEAVLAFRIPSWCDSFKGETKNGYAFFNVKNGDSIELNFVMNPIWVCANENVNDDLGKCALTCGPIVMCVEAKGNTDNLRGLVFKANSEFGFSKNKELGTVSLKTVAEKRKSGSTLYYPRNNQREELEIEFIPYYAFANRGESEMAVWVNVEN